MSDINPPIAPDPCEDNAGVGRSSGAFTTAAAGQPAMPLRDRFWVIGPGALLLAFFWQPALKLIAPFILTSISSLLVTGLVLVDVAAKLSRRFRVGLYLVGTMLGMTGIGEAIYFTSLAVPVSDANDRHCLAIEAHMLSDTAGRAGDAAMFQALGCCRLPKLTSFVRLSLRSPCQNRRHQGRTNDGPISSSQAVVPPRLAQRPDFGCTAMASGVISSAARP